MLKPLPMAIHYANARDRERVVLPAYVHPSASYSIPSLPPPFPPFLFSPTRTFLLLFLFLRPKVLSSISLSAFLASAFLALGGMAAEVEMWGEEGEGVRD